jgi:ATP-binding cassette subfamily C protein
MFSLILVIVFKEFSDQRLNVEGLSTILLSMNLFFNQMYVISCNVPELIRRIGILNNNKKFIEELFDYKTSNNPDVYIETGKIEFKNVSFSYNTEKTNQETLTETHKPSENVLTNKNVIIEDKEIVALFGTSGSGKSTFVKLIMKIISPQEGTILIDDKDINNMSTEFLKKYVTYISQDMSTLFNNSILYNIIYGTKLVDATTSDRTGTISATPSAKDEVVKLMSKYNLQHIYKNVGQDAEFLDYVVGKAGETLSGGQRQMIHLIRAILNTDSKILILDEPTSALDLETKRNVIKMIKNECKDKTVLIITHDEDVKNMCDRVLLFSKN